MTRAPGSSPRALSEEGPGSSAMTAQEGRSQKRWRVARRVGKVALFALGVGAVVLLIDDAGAEHVKNALLGAAPWIPLIVALDMTWFLCETLSHRAFLGDKAAQVPWTAFFRSAAMAYGVMTLLPAGRAGAEVARATAIARYVGTPSALAAAARVQSISLVANTLITVPCWLAVAYTASAGDALAWFLLLNGAATAALGTVLWLVSSRSRVGAWIGRKFPRIADHGAAVDEALRAKAPSAVRPLGFAFMGRLAQTLQYTVVLVAVGAQWTPLGGLVAQGIHLVGAGLGDFVPNQVGITEGAYRLFASALGLGGDPGRAISIALVIRLCQFGLALSCLAGTSVLGATRETNAAAKR